MFIFVFKKSTVPWKFIILFTPPEININNSKNALNVITQLSILFGCWLLIIIIYFICYGIHVCLNFSLI